MFWEEHEEENEAPKPQAVSKALEHTFRTCLSPLQGSVGGAVPGELVTWEWGEDRAGCEYAGSGHGIILLSEEMGDWQGRIPTPVELLPWLIAGEIL